MNKVSIYRGGNVAAYLTLHHNVKTGGVVGLVVAPYVNGKTVGYWQARRSGADAHVCGECPMRSKAAGGNGTCYVGNGSQVGMGLKWLDKSDDLPLVTGDELTGWLRAQRFLGARSFRSAVWGDAGMLPVDVWQNLEQACTDARLPILGYTHVAPERVPHLRRTHVASVDGDGVAPDDWRYFRVAEPGTRVRSGQEFACPASAERGHRIACNDCLACGEVGNAQGRRSVLIWRHDTAGHHATRRLLGVAAT